MKKIIYLFLSLAISMVVSPIVVVGAENNNVEQDNIILESGQVVSEEEFVQILESYEGEIYEISSDVVFESEAPSSGIQMYAAGATLPMNDVITIMAGSWYIPGIGKIIVAGGVIVVGRIALTKLSSWAKNKVLSWLVTNAINKQIKKSVSNLGNVNSNRARHILQTKHKWSSLVPGGPNDPNRWDKIKKIIEDAMKKGTESKYGSAYKVTYKYKGKIVEVTYQKLKNGVISISNAWVK